MQITKGTSVGKYLDSLISETLKSGLHTQTLKEKEKQVSLSSSNDKSGDTDFDSMSSSDNSDADADALQGDVELEDIIDKLNTIRAGKSFKDSIIEQRFEQYFNDLSKDERVAMFAFLKAISQIVSGEVKSSEIVEPADKPADIKIKKSDQPSQQTKSIKPSILKKPQQQTSSSEENTTSPIQVKKR